MREECVTRSLVIASLSVVLVVVTSLFGGNLGAFLGLEIVPRAHAQADDVPRVPVVAEPLQRRDVERHVTYYGVLQPRTTVQLALQVGGLVNNLPVDVGDSVDAGDVLLQLDTRDLEAQVRQAEAGVAAATSQLERILRGATANELAQARAAVSQAEVQLEATRVEYERSARLFESGSISRQAFDSVESQYQIAKSQYESALARLDQVQRGAEPQDIAAAEAQVKQAEAALDLALSQLDRATMKAPVSGVISRRGIEVGELAAPGTPVFTLVDLEELSIHLRAPGHDVIRLRPGMEARIVVEDDPALTLEGRIHRISPVADPQSNLFPVEVRLPNADGALKAGFHVAAQLTVASARDVLAVSERAVARREGQEGVYVVRDGRAVFIPVQFGITDGRAWREIVEAEGLREGDLIITIGKEYVIPGTPVRVQDLEDQGRRQ